MWTNKHQSRNRKIYHKMDRPFRKQSHSKWKFSFDITYKLFEATPNNNKNNKNTNNKSAPSSTTHNLRKYREQERKKSINLWFDGQSICNARAESISKVLLIDSNGPMNRILHMITTYGRVYSASLL